MDYIQGIQLLLKHVQPELIDIVAMEPVNGDNCSLIREFDRQVMDFDRKECFEELFKNIVKQELIIN